MSENGANPPEINKDGKTPVPPAATPPATPPVAPQPETVTLTKEQHDQLERDAARARTNQSKADRYDRIVARPGAIRRDPAAAAPSAEEVNAKAAEEDLKAERGLLALAGDPEMREILDASPDIRTMLLTNPLGVLPVFAPGALDAEDAISLVREKLLERKKPATPPPAAPAPSPAAVPPVGGVNVDSKKIDEEYEQARKTNNTEAAIAGMVKVGIKRLKK